jgi:AP2-associated kinase
MRRGRPKTSAPEPTTTSAKVASVDPFAALDSKSFDQRTAAVDELSSRFPSLDHFSLMHETGGKFQFSSTGSAAAPAEPQEKFKKRITEALADDAFAKATITQTGPAGTRARSPQKPATRLAGTVQPQTRAQPIIQEPRGSPPKPSMVSTGTMTSPPPSPSPRLKPLENSKPIWRVPQSKSTSREAEAPLSLYRSVDSAEMELPPRPEPKSSRPKILERTRTKSQSGLTIPKNTVSSRPSLEGSLTPLEQLDPIDRARSASARPAGMYVESNIDYLRTNEKTGRSRASSLTKPDTPKQAPVIVDASSDEEGPDEHIASDVAFLRSIESDDSIKKRHSHRSSSGSKPKRTSIPSISLSGTKTILAGKFGDAFRRFEAGHGHGHGTAHPDARSETEHLNAPLSPIMGSEKTGTSGRSDDIAIEETEELSPEIRREIERRRLSQEEKRVAAAAAEYRQRLESGNRAGAGPSKASTIQSRVKNLLDDSSKPVAVSRTAEGYGKYTDSNRPERPLVPRKPIAGSADRPDRPGPGTASPAYTSRSPISNTGTQQQLGMSNIASRTAPRPNVAPKPKAFRTGGATIDSTISPTLNDDEWETKFQKRYPSLSGIEMVETEIGNGSGRIRDV